jgi:hypothetical protein
MSEAPLAGEPERSLDEQSLGDQDRLENNDFRPEKTRRDEQDVSVSIVIPTFRRPVDLEKVIHSCLRQSTDDGGPFEIVVVDNSPERSAQVIVEDMATSDIQLRYVHEPRPGISHARNRCFSAAKGEFLAMIDDDEVAAPDWLFNLMRTQRMFDADVVFGPVHPRFDTPLDQDDEFLTAFYTYALPLPTGSDVGVRATNNALIRRGALDSANEPFDTTLGHTGGEDTLFFSKLQARGRRFVWSAEAIVEETVSPDRLQWSKIWHRAFQRGQCRASTPMLLPQPRPDQTLFWMGVGVLQVIGLAPLAALLWLPDRQRALYCTWKMISGVGKIFWMKWFRQKVYGNRPRIDAQKTLGVNGA